MCCGNKSTSLSFPQRVLTIAKLPVSQVAKGAVGLMQETLGINIAPDSLQKQRLDVCRNCEESTRSTDPKYAAFKGLTNKSRCKKCTCALKAKVRWQHSDCPLGKWQVDNTPKDKS